MISEEIKVGHFTCRDGVISGPEEYMADRGKALIAKIEGTPGANFQGTSKPGLDGIKAILGRFQADFTEWLIQKLISENLLTPANAKSFADTFIATDPKHKN